MSFDIFVQCFQVGESATIPRSAVRALFPVVESRSDTSSWQVEYDELHSCTFYVDEPRPGDDAMDGFMLNRPTRHPRLWDALFQVLQLGPVVLYFPGCDAPLVASEFAARQLPVDMINSIGKPRIVYSGEEIRSAIADS
jgi:hypothetical protein